MDLGFLMPSVFFNRTVVLLGKKKGLIANLTTLLVVLVVVWNSMSFIALMIFITTTLATNLFAFAFSYQNSLQKQQEIIY